MNFKVGDYVTRRSYNSDIVFKIKKLEGDQAILRSHRLRLMADAPLDDLKFLDKDLRKNLKKELMLESYEHLQRRQKQLILNSRMRKHEINNSYQEHIVRVLHLDGDQDYLELSLDNYKNLNIEAKGFYVPEYLQAERLDYFLEEYRPDILVLTGHDGELNNINYHTSKHFIKAVKVARARENDLDNLVIFAGACQSDYQDLIEAGANFASSPQAKLIHFLDPILIVEKIVYTSIRKVISVKEIVKNTITGEGGIGGIETRGKLRLRYP